jgi:hypothetical protein
MLAAMKPTLTLSFLAAVLLAAVAPDRAKFEPADGAAYHGVCLPGYWIAAEFEANLAKYREVTQRPIVLHSWFAHCKEGGKWRPWTWINTPPDGGQCTGEAREFAELDRKHGFVPVIAWAWMDWGNDEKSPRLQDVVAGQFDWYLDNWIEGVKAFKDPVFIRLSHEMDGDWYPYSEGWKKDPTRNTAADFIAYYRYVIDRFRKAGVTNVAWVWCVNGDRSGGKDWPDYWPGEQYVDWLGIDLYSSRNPKQVMGEFIAMYGTTRKPIMIPEGGTSPEQTKWNQNFRGDAAWVKEFFEVVNTTPQIKAVCWFQWDKSYELQRDPEQVLEYRKGIEGKKFDAKFTR